MKPELEPLEWKTKYELGLDDIDDHHRKLVDIINDIANLKGDDVSQSAFDGIMRRLKNYVEYHFEYEEKLLQKAGYSEFDAHKIEHDQFISIVTHLNDPNSKVNAELLSSIYGFLRKWLMFHILVSDRAYLKEVQSSSS